MADLRFRHGRQATSDTYPNRYCFSNILIGEGGDVHICHVNIYYMVYIKNISAL